MQEDPICNRCARPPQDAPNTYKRRMREVKTTWGYASMEKDGFQDSFHICCACIDELKEKWALFCSHCGEKVRIVAAELAMLNPRYYTNKLEVEKEACFIDVEFGQVGQFPLCEWCYEEFALSLKIPASLHYYMGGGETLSKTLDKNRLKEAISGRDIEERRKQYPRRFRSEYPTCPECGTTQSSSFKFCPNDGAKLNLSSTHYCSAFPPRKVDYEKRPLKEDKNYKTEILTFYISVPELESERNATFLTIPEKVKNEYFSRGSYCADSYFHDYPTEPGVHKCTVEFWEHIDPDANGLQFETVEEEDGKLSWRVKGEYIPSFGFHVIESEKVFSI